MIKKELLLCEDTLPPKEEAFAAQGSLLLGVAQTVMVGLKEILNIDLYGYAGMPGERIKLEARYFADLWGESFIAFLPGSYEWKEAGIDNIAFYLRNGFMDQNGNYYWRANPKWKFASDSDRRLARNYLGDIDVQRWENNVRSDRYYAGLSRKQRRINEMMDEKIPLIPEGFYTWVHEEVFGREYLYQRKQGKGYDFYCTACGKEWAGEKANRAGYTSCPMCGKKVLATFQKYHESKEVQLFLFQKCDGSDEWAERTFRAKAYWEYGHQRIVRWDEQIRIIIQKGANLGKCYYKTGIRGDAGEYNDRNTYQRRIKPGYLYPYNLDETKELWPSSLLHSGIEKMAADGMRINYNSLIMNAAAWPYLEYLIKGRFRKLAEQIVNDSVEKNVSLLSKNRVRSPRDLLQISSSQVDRIRQQDGGFIMLSWLQYEYRTGRKLTAENMAYLQTIKLSAGGSNMKTGLQYLTPNALVNYIRKQMELSGETFFEGALNTYCDYLDMAKKQKLNLAHEIFYKPKDLNAAHAACVEEGKKHELEMRAEEILEKFPDIQKNLDEIREKYSFADETFTIVVPAGIIDILREGRSLGHCIDTTDRYFDRINQNISYLVFLRRTGKEDQPYYTLEIEPGGTVRQQRTTGNNQNRAEVEEYTPFIRKWQQAVKLKLSEADRKQAAVSRDIRIREYRDLREKKEKVWHGKLAGQLLADVLEGDLIENVG